MHSNIGHGLLIKRHIAFDGKCHLKTLYKSQTDDILECQLKKMTILRALALLKTLWSSGMEHMLESQDAFTL